MNFGETHSALSLALARHSIFNSFALACCSSMRHFTLQFVTPSWSSRRPRKPDGRVYCVHTCVGTQLQQRSLPVLHLSRSSMSATWRDFRGPIPSLAKQILHLNLGSPESTPKRDSCPVVMGSRFYDEQGEYEANAHITDDVPRGMVWIRDGWVGLNHLTSGMRF